jgi:hypothetical protein
MLKETVVVLFKILHRHLLEGTKEEHEKSGLRVEIRAKDLLNTKEEC